MNKSIKFLVVGCLCFNVCQLEVFAQGMHPGAYESLFEGMPPDMRQRVSRNMERDMSGMTVKQQEEYISGMQVAKRRAEQMSPEERQEQFGQFQERLENQYGDIPIRGLGQ